MPNIFKVKNSFSGVKKDRYQNVETYHIKLYHSQVKPIFKNLTPFYQGALKVFDFWELSHLIFLILRMKELLAKLSKFSN